MARRVALALLLLGLLGTQVPTRGQDFDLSHALDDHDKKPTPAPPKQGTDDNFNLEDALGGGNNDPVSPEPPKPKPNPNPNQPGSSDGFSDLDLTDGTSGGGGGGGGNQRHDGEEQADSPGVVPGIVGAVAVAVAGAISSFIAYQKKKLCFKENADQGEVNMENHQGANAEPPGSSQPGGELDQEEVVQITETSQGQRWTFSD
ncbi:CD99 antigen-like isoform X2 [Eubalaena glacialis]|uniref:CD99 antigen-like isoform X2 n=1 Tax=Eubalaena glacialis TaxID=27606 RepID=UPI002A5B0948|nr:CD99 antigen-like isoform X2 [Eubalaena glacialis]